MANKITTSQLIAHLARSQRVIMLGGLAVISHGLSRMTYDGDTWLDPMETPEKWSDVVLKFVQPMPELTITRIGLWSEIPATDLPGVIADDGVVRIMGATQPLDIFRKPNEFEIENFEEVWQRATPMEDGTRLPDPIDLLVTKQTTGRPKDDLDIGFLENKAEEQYLAKLPTANAEEALRMLDRFLTPKVAQAALAHHESAVRETGLQFLNELAESGNPYAQEILKKLA